jgi:hypothetical protein
MRPVLLSLQLTIITLRVVAQAVAPIPAEVQTAMKELQKEPFHAHMAFLADDLLEGRGTGTRGHELAARYIAAQFEAMGLKPAGQNGTFYQQVPLREIKVDPERCALAFVEHNSHCSSDGATISSCAGARSGQLPRLTLRSCSSVTG